LPDEVDTEMAQVEAVHGAIGGWCAFDG